MLSRPRLHSRTHKATTTSALEPERASSSPTVASTAAAGSSPTRDGAPAVPRPPSVSPSANALLTALSSMGASPWAKNVYGKPFTNSELNALQVTCSRRADRHVRQCYCLGLSPHGPCADHVPSATTCSPLTPSRALPSSTRPVCPPHGLVAPGNAPTLPPLPHVSRLARVPNPLQTPSRAPCRPVVRFIDSS